MRLGVAFCLSLAVLSQARPDGVNDWHKPLAGIPLTHSRQLLPRFHRRQEGRRTESQIYFASEKNTLAALHPTHGTITWRHVLEEPDRIVNFRARGPFVVALSGAGGANFRVLDAKTGHILFEFPLHDVTLGRLSEPPGVGTHIAFVPETEDVVVLSNSDSVRRISLLDGRTKWSWTADDSVSLNLHSRVLIGQSNVYVVSLSKSFSTYTLHVTELDALTGEVSASYPLPGSLKNGIDDLIALEQPSEPSILWIENGIIKQLSLLTRKVVGFGGRDVASLVDLGLGENGVFVAQHADESAAVFQSGGGGQVPKQIWAFADSARSDKQSPSLYSGGLDKEGRPYVSRVFYAFAAKAAALSLFIPHASNETGQASFIALEYDTMSHGVITHVALDVADVGDNKYLSRAMLSTTMGSLQLWKGYNLQWTRDEGLSDLQAVQIVDLPEKRLVKGSEVGALLDSALRNLVTAGERVVSLSKVASEFLNDAVVTFISGKMPTPNQAIPAQSPELGVAVNASSGLYRDAFGFAKVIVAITSTGKIYGIHSTGSILWSRILGLDLGMIVPNPKLHVIRSVLDGAITPIVAVVANRQDGLGTVVLHLDAMSGKVQPPGVVPPHFASRLVSDVFPLHHVNRSLVLVDEQHKVATYPAGPLNAAVTSKISNIYYTRSSGTPLRHSLTGYAVQISPASVAHAKTAWSHAFGPTEAIQYTFKRLQGPVASFGKALADRGTLYKYLNPHIVGVVTANPSNKSQAVYLLDGVTGAILYHSTVSGTTGLVATMAENWLVFTYPISSSANSTLDQARGQRIVSVELYEGARNEKTRSSELSSFSPDMKRIATYENSFLLPHNVETMSMSSTKYGISCKDLIVATPEGQLQSFPRRLLDPRRHQNKPSAADGEEQLIPYEPVIPDDHRRVLSRDFDVVGVRHVITSPSLLESTSLVFAYGQDLFFTAVAPSGTFDLLSESFNKVQLVLIIAGLSFAIFVTKPIVQRRQLKQQWYS